MISSVSATSVSGGSSAEIYSDKTKDNYGLGENLAFHVNAQDNIAIGENAVNSSTSDALRNIGIGTDALTAINTGDDNVAIGYTAGLKLTSNQANIAIGSYALDFADGGESYNVAIGHGAMTGVNNSSADDNVAIGYNAGAGGAAAISGCIVIGRDAMGATAANAQTGTIAIGYGALAALTSGAGNIAIGRVAMITHTTGDRNIAIGYNAMDDTDATAAADGGAGGSAGTLASADNIFIGYDSGGGTWAGSDSNHNVAVGNYTMDDAMDGAVANTAVGHGALTSITTGTTNVGVGYAALYSETNGADNIAIGYKALYTANNGEQKNVAIGRSAMELVDGATSDGNIAVGYQALMGGSNPLTGNVVVGYQAGNNSAATIDYGVIIGYGAGEGALTADTDGSVFIGANAGQALTSGVSNTAIGFDALKVHTIGDRNTAIGYKAMDANNADFDDATCDYDDDPTVTCDANTNIAAGMSVTGTGIPDNNYITAVTDGGSGVTTFELNAATTGGAVTNGTLTFSGALASNDNTFIGTSAGGGTWTYKESSHNTAVGSLSMDGLLEGASSNTALGFGTLSALTTGDNNIAVGSNALILNTTGSNNTAVGYGSLDSNLSGEYNVAIGMSTLQTVSTTDANIAIGYQALYTYAGASNVAVGYQASKMVTGVENTSVGNQALSTHAAGAGNTAVGYAAMLDTDEGTTSSGSNFNTFIGAVAGGGTWANVASNNNTAVGYHSMDGALSGALDNTALGYNALGAVTTGDDNVAIGSGTGDGITTTDDNTAVGRSALSGAAGAGNTAIGKSSALSCTGAYNTALGYASMYTATAVDSCVAIGTDSLYTANEDDADGTIAIGRAAAYNYAPTGGAAIAGASTIIGYHAGYDNSDTGRGLTTGIQNTAVGHESLGANAGAALTGSANTVMGYRAGYGMHTGASNNTLIGKSAGDIITTGGSNTAMGLNAGNSLTTGFGNVALGRDSDHSAATNYQTAIGYNAVTQNTFDIALGYYGGIRMATTRTTLTAAGYSGTPADGDAAHTNALIVIPAYSYIKRVYATVITLSAGTADFQISMATATNIAGGAAVTGASGGVELLGAGASATHWNTRSQATQDGQSDINASSDDTAKVTWTSVNKDADDSTGWVGSGGVGIYLCHAGANDTSDPGADAVVQFTIEYEGLSV